MAAHTYWRLVFRQQVNPGTDEFIIHEIEFLETWTGPNTMSGATGTASVSSTFNPALYTAANLIDGDVTTRWISQTGTDNEWFKFVYNTPVEVRAVALTASIQLAFMPALFDLQWSDDGAAWTDVWTATSDYDTWNPFRHTFLAPIGAPAQVLADLTSTATGTGGQFVVTGTGLIELEALTSTGTGPGAAAQLRHQITGLMGTDRRTVALTGTQRQTKTLSATWAAQT
jgi:hypothetical protein